MLPESNIMYIECPTSIILNATYITQPEHVHTRDAMLEEIKNILVFFNNKN